MKDQNNLQIKISVDPVLVYYAAVGRKGYSIQWRYSSFNQFVVIKETIVWASPAYEKQSFRA